METITPITMPKRGRFPAKGFLPGQSGNPGGRVKVPADIKDAFRKYTPEAIETLVEILRKGRPADRLKAAEIILERAYGKPTQMLAGDIDGNPIGLNITVTVVD